MLHVGLPFDRGGANEVGDERMRITGDRSFYSREVDRASDQGNNSKRCQTVLTVAMPAGRPCNRGSRVRDRFPWLPP